MKIKVFWDMTLSTGKYFLTFRETCCLQLQVLKQCKKTIGTLIMEAASYSKVQVIITIQHGIPIPKDLNLLLSVLKHNWNIKNSLNSLFSVNCIHCTKGTRIIALCRKVLFKSELHRCGILG